MDQLHLHRSAGYLKMPGSGSGSGPLTWHMDYAGFVAPAALNSSDAFMNRSEVDPNGFYFYLNGSHPAKGGLAVLARSHKRDWSGPTGLAKGAGHGRRSTRRLMEHTARWRRQSVYRSSLIHRI